MAVAAVRITVATTATLLNTTSDNDPQVMSKTGVIQTSEVAVHNKGAASVYLGPSGVTTATGFELAVGETYGGVLAPDDTLYGICASGTVICHVLLTGV